MRWQHGRRSTNIENRRGSGVAVAGGGGGILVLALLVYLAGGDPTALLVEGASRVQAPMQRLTAAQEAEQGDFVSVVLGNTEDVWNKVFETRGLKYAPPVLVLFSGGVESACGRAGSSVGPFYCPMDRKVYLDLGFFHDLEHQLKAPGDFARAYVIAHEVGHHIQVLEGTSQRVRQMQQQLPEDAGRVLSVKLELQADCYSGVWAAHAQAQFNMIEPGDIDEALNAASQIGDDRLQQRSQGYVVPDAFTHGSSEQRHRWFQRGFERGDMNACDTFSAASL